MTSEKKRPREMLRRRAIQIGVKGPVAQYFRHCILSIEDVTTLAHRVGKAHRQKQNKCAKQMQDLLPELPNERPYMPYLCEDMLRNLGLIAGDTATRVSNLGRGKAKW